MRVRVTRGLGSWGCDDDLLMKACTNNSSTLPTCTKLVCFKLSFVLVRGRKCDRDLPSEPTCHSQTSAVLFEPAGTKHKTMLGARTGVGSIKSFPRHGLKSKLAASTKSTGLQNKTFYCETCDVHVNSDTQLKQVGQRPFKTLNVSKINTKQFISDNSTSSPFQNKRLEEKYGRRRSSARPRSSAKPRAVDFYQ